MKTLPFIAILVSMFLTPDSLAQKLNQVVLDAYEIRMNGNADEAADMLRKYIEKDSSNAMVYFEYARALCHLSPSRIDFNPRLRNPGYITDTLTREAALRMIDKAISIDRNNHCFHQLRGSIFLMLPEKPSREEDSIFSFIEDNFELVPSVELASALYGKYLLDSLMGTLEVDPMKMQKFKEYIKSNDRFEYLKQIKWEDEQNRNMKHLAYYKQFLVTDSLNVKLLKELGYQSFLVDSIELGIGFYEKALNICGDYQEALGELWRSPLGESRSMRSARPLSDAQKFYEEWRREKLTAFLETGPDAPIRCLAYMSLSNSYKKTGEEEQARKMDLAARESDPYFYELGFYEEMLLRHPNEIFKYSNLIPDNVGE
ncbi:hypothetical protein [Maribellus sediminis]|uniref:hypothetical protein n=1 Tax=Maribellus sediminis TaxID=2696285 RepID=UPI0014317C3D|nr:hypothetical protein [Maribellus sediminis]